VIIVIGRAEAEPDRLDSLRAIARDMMRATWEESGCLSYSMAVEDEGGAHGPAVITVVERWQDEAALLEHFHTEHMRAFNAAVDGAVRSLDLRIFDVAGERTLAEVKAGQAAATGGASVQKGMSAA
jgi:quinol monooxygenase YgiN